MTKKQKAIAACFKADPNPEHGHDQYERVYDFLVDDSQGFKELNAKHQSQAIFDWIGR